MAKFSIKKPLCFICLLLLGNFCHANSNHNIYMMTLSILSYAKLQQANPELCIIDNSEMSNQFIQTVQKQNIPLKVNSIKSKDIKLSNCNILFFSKSQPNIEQQLIKELSNKPILSFSSNNDDCEIGSVFCLYKNKTGNTQFKVNLDSLAKSRIHIDPRVLLLAQNME
jgi:hypothetical protein